VFGTEALDYIKDTICALQNFGREIQNIDMSIGLGLDAKILLKCEKKCGLASTGSGQRSVSGCCLRGHELWPTR